MGKDGLVFLPKYDESGASSRYRHYKIAKSIGLSSRISPFFKEEKGIISYISNIVRRQITIIRNYSSTFYVEADFFPYLPFNLIVPSRYILDFDDPVWFNEKFGTIIWKRKFTRLVRNSSAIVCGSHALKDYIVSEFGASESKITWIPTTLSNQHYHDRASKKSLDLAKEMINVVWIGSPYTSYMVDSIAKTCKESIRWHLIGYQGELEQSRNVRVYHWSPEMEVACLGSDIIGVAPMTGKLRHERYKCGFKTVQYLAMGLPIVASKFEPNYQILGDYSYYARVDDWENIITKAWSDRARLSKWSSSRFNEICLEKQLSKYINLLEKSCVE